MYKAIIFDFFGVLSSEVSTFWFDKYFKSNRPADIDEKMKAADMGLITEDEFLADLSKIVHAPASEIKKEWRGLAHVDPVMLTLIERLKRDYKVALCTNVSASFLYSILSIEKLQKLFDVIIISSEVRITKPSKDIYQLTLDKLGVRADEAVLIDDNSHNLTAAKDLGITTILFNNREDLVRDLQATLK